MLVYSSRGGNVGRFVGLEENSDALHRGVEEKKLWSISTTGYLKEIRPACFDCDKLLDFFFSMTLWLPLDHIINK